MLDEPIFSADSAQTIATIAMMVTDEIKGMNTKIFLATVFNRALIRTPINTGATTIFKMSRTIAQKLISILLRSEEQLNRKLQE